MIQEQQPDAELEAEMMQTGQEIKGALERAQIMDEGADELLKRAEDALGKVTDDFVEGEEKE